MADGPQRTPDGHHIVVDGRRWRASDPAIPDKLRVELVAELMAARRAVKAAAGEASATAEARARVQDAKVALGERGHPWWEAPQEAADRARVEASIRTLLRKRAPSTICPSDAARVSGGDRWRDLMPLARQVALEWHREGLVEVQQGGQPIVGPEVAGPIRIAPTQGGRQAALPAP